jgi:glycerophosphoryl diester phosphodiesterase
LTFFTALMRTGVDGVFADQPDLALEARAALA